jgi:hypothetical protein
MKILFLARRYMDFRNFDSVVRELAVRGHRVHLAAERDNVEGRPVVERLAAECPGLTYSEAPAREPGDWSWSASRLRGGIEHLRYQDRMFDDTPKLRDRSRERTAGAFVSLGRVVRRYVPWTRRPISAALTWLERATPESPAVHAFLEAQRPDVVLITPLIGLGSSQVDYLRAARSRRIPTALCVWSWDHLSSKALIRDMPDRVFVWNDTQKGEAITLHNVPEHRIVVTGAQCFDKWFDRRPSRSAEVFRRDVGLPADRPFLLYVCSAPFIGSQPEAPFVVDWIRRVRGSALPHLRHAPILVRPHPSRRAEWESIDLRGIADVVVFGSTPIDEAARADYFDSLYHSALVVGLNTSAFIEAGIIGRPVHTILLPEWHENQMGTVHFRYLFDAGGGLLTAATTFDEHLRQLDEALARPAGGVRPFVRAFVRPHGLEVAATPLFVRQVEAMAATAADAPVPPVAEAVARRLLLRAHAWRNDPSKEHWLYSERERDTLQRMHALHSSKAARRREIKQRRVAEKAAREDVRQAELREHRAAKKTQDEAPGHPASR